MEKCLRLQLRSRHVHFCNVSLRVAEVDASPKLLAGGEAIAETLFSLDCEAFEGGLRAFAYGIKARIAHKCKSALAGGPQ